MQSSRWRHIVRREHGQTLVIGILFMTVLLGMVAMTVDVGLLFRGGRNLQNWADAMALAGVAELPQNPGQAQVKARQWAANNGIAPGDIKKIEVRATGVPNDTLYVELENNFGWIFGRVLGQTTSKVGADAAARIGSLSGGHQMMPWALLRGDTNCLDAVTGAPIFGATCQVKVGAGSSAINGWYGALVYDGNGHGASAYKVTITI